MTSIPYLPGEIRQYLEADPVIQQHLHGGKITCREVPDPLRVPHITVKAVVNHGEAPLLRRPLIQVTPWVPGRDVTGIDEDPDRTAWTLAWRAGEVLGRAKNILIDEDGAHTWSANWIEGPIQLEDKTRGADRVLYYAPVRVATRFRRRAPI